MIPAAALTGQAAGMAAWLAIKRGTSPGGLSVDVVQEQLRRAGVAVHLSDVSDRFAL